MHGLQLANTPVMAGQANTRDQERDLSSKKKDKTYSIHNYRRLERERETSERHPSLNLFNDENLFSRMPMGPARIGDKSPDVRRLATSAIVSSSDQHDDDDKK